MLPFASTIAFWSMTSGSSKVPLVFLSHFPNRTKSAGGQWDIAFPINAETRNMIEQAVLAEYEKVVAGSDR
jgi:DNA-binding cell septation regulator SpoVG